MESRDHCDESKCVSQGAWNLFSSDTSKPFMNPFTCYGDDGIFYPKMCADGYLPVVVEDEPPLLSADWYADLDANIPVSYFTCCPPPITPAPEPTTAKQPRHCSDPVVGLANDTSCAESEYQTAARQMKTNRMTDFIAYNYTFVEIDSYLCCDDGILPSFDSGSNNILDSVQRLDGNATSASNSNSTTNYLNDTECVPYRSPDYDGFLRENAIGHIVPITCEFPDGSFSVPRPSPTGRFQCCRTGTPMPPYVHDANFTITVYPVFILWIVVALLSAIGVVGLLIPLAKELRHRNTHQSQKQVPLKFSTYNLYLLYLMFLDLVFALLNIGMCGDYINQNYNPSLEGVITIKRSLLLIDYRSFRESTMIWAYTIGTFWLNAIILNQVLFFLETFQSGRRVKPPSLTRVNVQCGAVYALVLVSGVTFFLFCGYSRSIYYMAVYSWQALVYPPMFYIFWVPIRIWWKGYMPTVNSRGLANPTTTTTSTTKNLTTTTTTSTTSTTKNLAGSMISTGSRGIPPIEWRSSGIATMNSVREKALRELAFYFLRIVFIFVGLWLPSAFLMYAPLNRGVYWTWLALYCIYAIQPIVSFGFILTKSDVRQYIVDLVRCSAFVTNEASPTDIVPRQQPSSHASGDPSLTINTSSNSRMGNSGNGNSHAASPDSDSDPEEGPDAKIRRESTCFFQMSETLSEPFADRNTCETIIDDDADALSQPDKVN